MQKSTILELSRYNSKDKPYPAQWTTRLSKPTTITNGTIIQVKDSFIDCRLIDSQSIEIPEDTNLSFQFIYWMQRNGIGQYTVFRDAGPEGEPLFSSVADLHQLDGVPFMLVDISTSNIIPNAQSYKPVVETATVSVPAGVYERSNLADYITRQFQRINYKGPVTINGLNQNNTQNFTAGQVFQNYDSNGNFLNFTQPTAPVPPKSQIISTFQKQIYLGIWDGEGGDGPQFIPDQMCLFYLDAQGRYHACQLVPMTDIQNNGISQYGFFAPCMTPNNSNAFSIYYEGYTFYLTDAGMIGTGAITLTYNAENGNGKFAFDYMHNPLIDDNSGNQVAGVFVDKIFQPEPNPQEYPTSYINAASGIMFVNIYDDNTYNENEILEVPLLNQMGFTINDLIPVDSIKNVFKESNQILWYYGSSPYVTFPYSDFQKYTTRNLITMNNTVSIGGVNVIAQGEVTPQSSYYIKTYPSAYLPIYGGFNLSDSNNTEPINASSFPVSSLINSGHFLVCVDGYQTEHLTEEGFQLVKAIVSNYYFSENFASALEDSLIYQHYGEPITIQNLNISILNPATKQLARNLGGNSCIYLQVIHPINETQQTKK